MSVQLSQFMPPSPSSAVFTSPFSLSVSVLLPCTWVHQYHLSRFHTFALICDICFSFSDFTVHDRFLFLHGHLLVLKSECKPSEGREFLIFFFFPSGFVQCSKPSNLDPMTNL